MSGWLEIEERVRSMAQRVSFLAGHKGWTDEQNWVYAEGQLVQTDLEVYIQRAVKLALARTLRIHAALIKSETVIPQNAGGWATFHCALANELRIRTADIGVAQTAGEVIGKINTIAIVLPGPTAQKTGTRQAKTEAQ